MKSFTILKLLIAFSLVFFVNLGYSQPANSADKQEIINEATAQLTQMTAENGELSTFCAKNNIKGEFVVDLTLEGKGNVLTVFMVSGGADDIAHKNLLKDKLYALRFEKIKIPKKEKVKFRQTFKF